MSRGIIRQVFLLMILTLIGILIVSTPAFASTSIKYGWVALDSDKKPVLQGSQYPLSSAVKPIAYISNGATVKNVSAKSVVYLSNTKAGTAQALILGDNIVGCKDAFITTFTIVNRVDISKSSFSNIPKQAYTGKPITPKITVKYGGKKLKENKDYRLSYKNHTNAGTASVIVTGLDMYQGTKTLNFTIYHDISKATIQCLDSYPYTGKAVKPTPTVKYMNSTLKANVDYTVSYKDNIKAGTAKLIVTGKGSYSGSKSKDFKIIQNKVSIDKTVMMLDNCHYNFTKLTANTLGQYKASKVTWTVSDSNIAAFKSDGKYKKTIKNKSTITLYGRNYGTTTVTAKLPDGKKATCKVRVIVSASEKVKGDVYYSGHGSYVRPLKSKENLNGWGDNYVEAYVNNAAWLVKNYPTTKRFEKEAKAKTIHGYVQNVLTIKADKKKRLITSVKGTKVNYRSTRGYVSKSKDYNSFTHYTKKKAQGQLSPNDRLFLFTHKNQWAYMLKKDKNGVWHVTSSLRTSAGYEKNRYEQYGVILANESQNGGGGLWLSRGSGSSKGSSFSLYTNSNHISGTYRIGQEGRPVTAGCILMGRYNYSHVFYDLFYPKNECICTRMINF